MMEIKRNFRCRKNPNPSASSAFNQSVRCKNAAIADIDDNVTHNKVFVHS